MNLEMTEQNADNKVVAGRRASQEKRQSLEQSELSNESSIRSARQSQDVTKQSRGVEESATDDFNSSDFDNSGNSQSDSIPTNEKKMKSNSLSASNSKTTNLSVTSIKKEFAYDNSKMKSATAEKSITKLQQFLSIKKAQSVRNMDSDNVSRGAFSVVDKVKSKNGHRTSGSASVAPIEYKVRNLKSPSKSVRNLKSTEKSTQNLDTPSPNPSPIRIEDTSDSCSASVAPIEYKVRKLKTPSKSVRSLKSTEKSTRNLDTPSPNPLSVRIEDASDSGNASVAPIEYKVRKLKSPSKSARNLKSTEKSTRNLDAPSPNPLSIRIEDASDSGSASVAPIEYKVRKLKSPSKSARNLKSTEKSTRNLDAPSPNPSPIRSEDTSDTGYRIPGNIRQQKSISKNLKSRPENSSPEGDMSEQSSTSTSQSKKPTNSDGRRLSKPTSTDDSRSGCDDDVNESSPPLRNSKRNSTSKNESTLSSSPEKPTEIPSKVSRADETLKTRHLRRLVDPTIDNRDESLVKFRETSEKSNRMLAGTRRASLSVQKESDRLNEYRDNKSSANSKKSRRSSDFANTSPSRNSSLPSKSNPTIKQESAKISNAEDSDAVRDAAVAALEAAINAAKLAGLAVDVKVLTTTDSPVDVSPTISKRGSNGSSLSKKMSRSDSGSDRVNTSKPRRNTSDGSNIAPESPSHEKVARSNSASATSSIPKKDRRSSTGSSAKSRRTIHEDDPDDNESVQNETKASKNKSSDVRRKRTGSKDHLNTERDDIFTFFCWSDERTNETEIRRNRQRMKDSMAGSPLNTAYARFSSITNYDD